MRNKIISIVSDILNIQANDNTNLSDISSMKILQIVMALDEEEISIPLEKVTKLKNVKDLLAFAVQGKN